MSYGSKKYRAPNVVFFDLETTGFDRPIRPVQIGAIDSWGANTYNQFVWPRRHVHPKATLTNKFYVSRGTLFRQGEGALDTTDLEDALYSFLDWLSSLGGNVVLVAHKCLDYDAKVLLRNLEEFNIPYEHVILGFSDSLLASRDLYPVAPSHKLSSMLGEVGLPIRESHDALVDADDCRRICRRMAGQRRLKFLDFVFDEKWYHTLDDQWEWTFPGGVVTV
ncbi:uncharacterized protein LOC111704223 [Eurytemora carolleeae]|uniref:uncharacterized protein LOC111704223 n=1 Tax=Eurytemora carolleeae TaxID=1294199 RepID=UPI000C774DC7|nr:uncharacterized protein LOC111704223 [Eurytemora carolleeae]|eukprot:XP_023332145.1 uncharacterized protein LOC111704223 [Eurytemora affinis]